MALRDLKFLFPAGLVVVLIAVLPMASSAQHLAEGNERLSLPKSHLGESFETPVFITGHFGVGGDYEGYGTDIGYGGSLIFRPGHPVNLLGTLFRWNVGTIAQVDYQRLDGGGSWTAVDIVARRYFGNRGTEKVPVNLFLGLGTGGAFRKLEGAEDTEDETHWTWLVEAGQEWFFKPTHMIFIKGQYRWFLVDDKVDGQWSVMVGAGFRWPW